MRSGGYATRPAAVAARRADETIYSAKDRLKQASGGFLITRNAKCDACRQRDSH